MGSQPQKTAATRSTNAQRMHIPTTPHDWRVTVDVTPAAVVDGDSR
jgi:hypothetical protein